MASQRYFVSILRRRIFLNLPHRGKYHSAKPNIIGNAYSIVITPASISQTVSQSVSMS